MRLSKPHYSPACSWLVLVGGREECLNHEHSTRPVAQQLIRRLSQGSKPVASNVARLATVAMPCNNFKSRRNAHSLSQKQRHSFARESRSKGVSEKIRPIEYALINASGSKLRVVNGFGSPPLFSKGTEKEGSV